MLAIWTERVKTAEVMRSLGVPYITLQQWQERAMEGMLQALEPRVNLADGGALRPRIRALMEKRQLPAPGKLLGRLEQLGSGSVWWINVGPVACTGRSGRAFLSGVCKSDALQGKLTHHQQLQEIAPEPKSPSAG